MATRHSSTTVTTGTYVEVTVGQHDVLDSMGTLVEQVGDDPYGPVVVKETPL